MEVTQQKGFTLTEMAVSVAVLSVLASISIPGYNMYIARQQAAESVVLMDTVKSKTLQNIIKIGKCTEVGTTETLSGKYGNLVVSGTASKTALIDNQVLQKTGCIYTYTLKADAHRFISGKTIVADLFNNGALSKSALTTVDNRYMPKSLVTLVEGVKSTINGDTPVTTPTTTVVQLVPETTPTNPTPTNPTPTAPTPTNPTPTNPTPTNPTPTTPTDPMDGGQTPVPTLVPANCGYLLFSPNKPHLYCWKNGGTAELIGNTGGGINQEIFDAGKLFYSRYLTYGCQAEHSYTSGTFYLPKCVDQRVAIEYESKRFGGGWVYRKKGSGGIWVNGDTARAN